ncbi:MAG: TRAP transporter substrate-binding protein [Clostridiales bacterium]
MRKKMVLLLCFLMALSVAGGCQRGVWAADSGVDYVIRVGHVLATDHPYTDGLNYFKKVLEEKTDGRVRVEVFPNSMLGNERDMIEGLQLGTLEMALVSTAPLSGFTSDFLVFDLPYIFTDTATARGCVDSEVGMGMLEDLASQGIKGLLYFENGFRSVTNSRRPIQHPEDLQGIKIRTMENPIHMDSFSAMGADPTPMAFGELFTALQQKTIDGQENPLAIVDTSKFYEVQTYLSLTEHFYAPAPFLMALDYYNNLPEDVRNAVYEAAKEAQDYERGLLDEMNARLLKELVEKGIQINEIDKAEFRAAVQSVYDKFEGTGSDKIPAELIEKVQNFKP